MDARLARKLVERGAIRAGMEIEAEHTAQDHFSGAGFRTTSAFAVISVVVNEQGLFFVARRLRDSTTLRIPCEAVKALDGMAPMRFAGAFGVTSKGEDIPPSKRRGRPPKNEMKCGRI